jgi:DNA (cytosine-5)-methyltransferase 1
MFMSLQTKTDMKRAQALRKVRESLGLSRAELGRIAQYSARQIARWELGEVAVRESFFQYMLGLRAGIGMRSDWKFTFIDLFAGIGGFRKGFEAVGGGCIFTSEWDRYAQKTYVANFGDHEVHGDITKIDASDIPDHDVLVAGFPCQPLVSPASPRRIHSAGSMVLSARPKEHCFLISSASSRRSSRRHFSSRT